MHSTSSKLFKSRILIFPVQSPQAICLPSGLHLIHFKSCYSNSITFYSEFIYSLIEVPSSVKGKGYALK